MLVFCMMIRSLQLSDRRTSTILIILRPLHVYRHKIVGIVEEMEAVRFGEGTGVPGGRLITGVDIKTTKTAENLSNVSILLTH